MNRDLALKTLRNSTGVAVYVFLVSQIMLNGEKLFGKEDNMFMPFALLLLFSLSAAVVGSLLFGQSIILFLEGKKKEGIQAVFYSIGWLAVYTALGLSVLLVLK